MGMSGPGQTDANSIVSDPKSGGVGFADADLINIDGSESSQITLGTPPAIADWGGFSQGTTANQPTYNGAINRLTVPNFDGVNDYLSKSGTLGIGDRTFQVVFKKPTTGVDGYLFAADRSLDAAISAIVAIFSDGTAALRTGAAWAITNIAAVPDNSPVVLTILAPLGAGLTFYINGVDETLNAGTFAPSGLDDRLIIGFHSSDPFALWDGDYGALKVWSWVLSSEERTYWDSVAFAKWNDADFINIDSSDSSQITLGTPPAIADWGGFSQGTPTNQPNYDGAINALTVSSFDGVDNYLWKAGALGTGNRTFQIVFKKPTTISTLALFAGSRSFDGFDSFVASVTSDGKIFLLTSGGIAFSNAVVPNNVPVVVTILAQVGAGITFYINGVDETLTPSTFTPDGLDDRLMIGARTFNAPLSFWDGDYGALKVWNRVLTPTERAYWDSVAFAKWGIP